MGLDVKEFRKMNKCGKDFKAMPVFKDADVRNSDMVKAARLFQRKQVQELNTTAKTKNRR